MLQIYLTHCFTRIIAFSLDLSWECFMCFTLVSPRKKKSVKDKSLLHFCRNVEGILLKYNAFTAQLGYLCSYR